MPIQENSGALPSESATKKGKQFGTLVNGALAVAKKNTTATTKHFHSDLTKEEALALAWTGIEALAHMKQANLYRSPKTGRVVIELLATKYDTANGLTSEEK